MVKTVTSVPVVEGLFTAEGQLLGSRCPECEAVFFPRRSYCRNPDCSRKAPEDILLSKRGTLYSFTVQHYMGPLPFKLDSSLLPYAVLLIDLPEGVRVMGMLDEDVDPESLQIGMQLEVTVGRLYQNDQGQQVITWKFRPVKEQVGK